jgi:hypothetical protein
MAFCYVQAAYNLQGIWKFRASILVDLHYSVYPTNKVPLAVYLHRTFTNLRLKEEV